MTRTAPALITVMAGLLLGSCCTLRRAYPAPTSAALLAALDRRDAGLFSIRGKAKVDQFTPKGRIKVLVYLLATREGKLRFEAVSPFDTPLATLVSDGTRFTSIDHQNHRRYVGEARPCNIARVLGMALQPTEVARALFGGAPRQAHDSASVRFDRCLGAEVLTLRNTREGTVQRIYLRRHPGDRYQVLRMSVHGRAGLMLDLRYEDFRTIKGQLLPRVIKFRQGAKGSDVIIRYGKQEPNVTLPDAAFVLPGTDSLPEEEMNCN